MGRIPKEHGDIKYEIEVQVSDSRVIEDRRFYAYWYCLTCAERHGAPCSGGSSGGFSSERPAVAQAEVEFVSHCEFAHGPNRKSETELRKELTELREKLLNSQAPAPNPPKP